MLNRRQEIKDAGLKAIDELIKVLRDPIINNSDDSDISPDKMRAAASAKRLAFEDALAMLKQIEDMDEESDEKTIEKKANEIPVSFVEAKANKKK